MGRLCTVCTHEEREAIDRALVERTSGFRDIAGRFHLARMSLYRHYAEHLPATIVKAADAKEVARADDLLGRLLELHDETLEILDHARDSEEHELALKAIARAEKQIELQARLLGELREGVTINLFQSAEWIEVVTSLLHALDPFPDAKLRVAEVLSDGRG